MIVARSRGSATNAVVGLVTLLFAVSGCTSHHGNGGSPASTGASTTRSAPAGTPVVVSLSWTGEITGNLASAVAVCHLYANSPTTDVVDLRNANGSVDISIPRHNAPGAAAVSATTPPGVSMHITSPTTGALYLGTAGSITYSAGGDSGTIAALLSKQGAGSLPSPSVHLVGNWTCR